jgi:hypothetical protein
MQHILINIVKYNRSAYYINTVSRIFNSLKVLPFSFGAIVAFFALEQCIARLNRWVTASLPA